MSSIEKFTYSVSHPEHYESFDFYPMEVKPYLRRVQSKLPQPWKIVRSGIWLNALLGQGPKQAQGWKIHVSAMIANAEEILERTVPLLVLEDTDFKFVLDPSILYLVTGKRWYRGGGGKFMTIYPHDDEHFRHLLRELHSRTASFAGPYILSDRRYPESRCLFYRYGGVQSRYELTERGTKTLVIAAPDGTTQQDVRQAAFVVPKWTSDPFADPKPASPPVKPKPVGLNHGRYEVAASLRFSNSGGLYLARDNSSGEDVVLKEARLHTNIDDMGRDAILLLKKEFRLLHTLADTGIAPRPIDFFEEWEHSFLVQEYIKGPTLRQDAILHNLTRTTRPSEQYIEEFLDHFRQVFTSIAESLLAFEALQIIYGDLSPTNLLLTEGNKVRMVDFEAACQLGVDRSGRMFTPGYAAADRFLSDVPAFSSDYYGLGALMLSYFMPIHAMIGLDRTAGRRFVSSIACEYKLPLSLPTLITTLMADEPERRPHPKDVICTLAALTSERTLASMAEPATIAQPVAEVSSTVGRIAEYISGSATLQRRDRLFPPDPTVFATNPLGLAYGACGTTYALQAAGQPVGSYVDWIESHPVDAESYPPGLYVGMAGIAWCLLALGRQERACTILRVANNHPLASNSAEIFFGAAGLGLANLHFFLNLQEQEYLDRATAIGDDLLRVLKADKDGVYWGEREQILYGFAHGSSGIATFLLYLYLATKIESYLEAGRKALEFDLAHATRMNDSLLWPSSDLPDKVLVPYWRYGTAGIGAALLRYYLVDQAPPWRPLLEEMRETMVRRHAIYPGRAFGLTSLGELLLDMRQVGFHPQQCAEDAATVASGVNLFAIDKGAAGIAYPGAELWKISCDYLSGSAGIMLFLHRLKHGGKAHFMCDELLPGLPQQESEHFAEELFTEEHSS